MFRSSLLLATVALCGLTALGLLGAGLALRPPATLAVDTSVADANRAVALRFYDAVNLAIRTGDTGTVEAIVAPGFVDRVSASEATTDRAALVRYLRSLHATAPEASVSVETVASEGDRVVVQVAVRDADRRTFVGIPIAGGLPVWAPLEVVRVADGRVIERWGTSEEPALLEPLGRFSPDHSLPDHAVVSLERLAVHPGGSVAGTVGQGTRAFFVDGGTIAVSIDPAARGRALVGSGDVPADLPRAVLPGTSTTLASGEFLVVPPRTGYVLSAEGDEPAVLLVAALVGADELAPVLARSDPAYASAAPPSTDPVQALPVAGGRSVGLPADGAAVAVGQATLAPGAALPTHRVAGPELIYVESGDLHVESDEGAAWVTRGATGTSSERDNATLSAGDGALLRNGATATLRNAGNTPLVLLLVTVLPSDDPGVVPAG